VETREFFIRELVFTADDYAKVRGNLKDLATKLHQACLQSRLKLDLDLQAHLSAVPPGPIAASIIPNTHRAIDGNIFQAGSSSAIMPSSIQGAA
jgi:hypothetical protein